MCKKRATNYETRALDCENKLSKLENKDKGLFEMITDTVSDIANFDVDILKKLVQIATDKKDDDRFIQLITNSEELKDCIVAREALKQEKNISKQLQEQNNVLNREKTSLDRQLSNLKTQLEECRTKENNLLDEQKELEKVKEEAAKFKNETEQFQNEIADMKAEGEEKIAAMKAKYKNAMKETVEGIPGGMEKVVNDVI